jgi:hypothetical protein
MSFDYRGLINSTDDPMMQLVTELQKKLAKKLKEDAVALVETDNEDVYSDGQDVESVVCYHSELYGQKLFNFATAYYPSFEPDGIQNTIMLRGTSLGNTLPDRSGFGNNAVIQGEPNLVDGTLDLGYHTNGVKSVAMRLNRPTSSFEFREWLQVPDNVNIQFASMATGFSIFFRVRFLSLADHDGKAPTGFEKIDDSTPSNAIMFQANSTGKLIFIVKKAGSTTAKETAVSTVTTNTVYDIFLTFTVSGSVAHIYVDGTDKTLSTYAGAVDWHLTLTNHDLFIARRGLGTTGGFAYMDFYDFKSYKNRIVTQTEVTRHQTNKWTISNHAFGTTMLTNYWNT